MNNIKNKLNEESFKDLSNLWNKVNIRKLILIMIIILWLIFFLSEENSFLAFAEELDEDDDWNKDSFKKGMVIVILTWSITFVISSLLGYPLFVKNNI